ncbi:MAG: ATP-dependent Clp protease adaptor ClpS [Thermodesulfobacteriota bacterium]
MSEEQSVKNINNTETFTEELIQVKKPDLYKVVLLNDDYTPRDFVVWILITVFYKNQQDSTRIMIEAHTKGKSIIESYPYDIAKTKLIQVEHLAEKYEHPLKCILEVESGDH